MNYQWYGKHGDEILSDDMPDYLAEVDVVLFGELHGNPLIHQCYFPD